MGQSLLVIGESGSGKSTSLYPNEDLGIKGLDPKETFIINISRKSPPFKGWKKSYVELTEETKKDGTANMFSSDNSASILKCMDYVNKERLDIKNLVIEDVNLSSSRTFFNRFKEDGWDKFNQIGGDLGSIILYKDKFREDLNSIYVFHVDTYEKQPGVISYKTKTLGKVVEDKLTPETKFTTVLHAVKEWNPVLQKSERWFYNNDYPGSPAKSPYGMFEEHRTVNDLGLVLEKMEEFDNG